MKSFDTLVGSVRHPFLKRGGLDERVAKRVASGLPISAPSEGPDVVRNLEEFNDLRQEMNLPPLQQPDPSNER